MSATQRVAQVFGVVFVVIGALGFALGGVGMETHMLLGLFPVNALHNVAHLVLGIWGVVAARGGPAPATSYCRIAGVIYVALFALAFISPDTLGLMPIGGNNRWLHLALGVTLVYVGFRAPKPLPRPM